MTHSDPAAKVEDRLWRDLSGHVFRQLPVVLFTSIILSGLVVQVLWNLFPKNLLLSWLTAVVAISALRFILFQSFRRQANEDFTPHKWLRLYSIGALAAGATWGIAPILFYTETSPQSNIFLAFVLGGLIAGASSSMAPLKVTMRIFTALVCVPVALRFLTHGDFLNQVMGVMLLLYGGAYLFISSNTARTLIESLNLRYANLREIEERRRAEGELRSIQQSLEETVARRTVELSSLNEELSREIDERRHVESRLRLSEECYRSLVESSSDWIWEVDANGTLVYSSPSISAMLGYTQEEVVGRHFYDFMPPSEAERVKTILDVNAASGNPFVRLVSRCLHKDGSERILEAVGEPIRDHAGTLAGYRGIDRDITCRVRHEADPAPPPYPI